MNSSTRRTFLGASTVYPLLAGGVRRAALFADSKEEVGKPVYFAGDGCRSPAPSTQAAGEAGQGRPGDTGPLHGGRLRRGAGGAVRQGARQGAGVFVPTGTLANHLAIRSRPGQDPRPPSGREPRLPRLVDCVQTLSHLNLVPLGADKATVPLAEFEEASDARREAVPAAELARSRSSAPSGGRPARRSSSAR